MQWSTAHIHLADQHHHGGDHHQHAVESHSHHTIAAHASNHHADAIDTAHSDQHTTIVELDNDCNASNGKTKTPGNALITSTVWQSTLPSIHRNHYARFFDFKPGYLDQSTIQLRAPPLYT